VGELRQALEGIESAVAAGFSHIKLNTVLMGGVNDDDIRALVRISQTTAALKLRFIELMPMGVCADWEESRFVGAFKGAPRLSGAAPLRRPRA
jgi:cyclic pyranopterin phosphate synthase